MILPERQPVPGLVPEVWCSGLLPLFFLEIKRKVERSALFRMSIGTSWEAGVLGKAGYENTAGGEIWAPCKSSGLSLSRLVKKSECTSLTWASRWSTSALPHTFRPESAGWPSWSPSGKVGPDPYHQCWREQPAGSWCLPAGLWCAHRDGAVTCNPPPPKE